MKNIELLSVLADKIMDFYPDETPVVEFAEGIEAIWMDFSRKIGFQNGFAATVTSGYHYVLSWNTIARRFRRNDLEEKLFLLWIFLDKNVEYFRKRFPIDYPPRSSLCWTEYYVNYLQKAKELIENVIEYLFPDSLLAQKLMEIL